MPTIASFYGITIMMYLKDKEHNPPHIHASYGGDEAAFSISTGEMLWDTKFPKKAKKAVKRFILKHQSELNNMWNTGKYKLLPSIE